MVAAALILSLCCVSLLLVGLAKLYHYYQPAHHQHTALASPNNTGDRDTLSSRGSASAHEFLQLEPASEAGAGVEGHYGRSLSARQPRGILKQSRTSESLTYCTASSSLTLYSNPALEPQCSPLRLQDPERQQVVSTLASGTLERQALGSPMHNWQPTDPGFPGDPQASPRLLSDPHQQRGCGRVSQTSLLCSSREPLGVAGDPVKERR